MGHADQTKEKISEGMRKSWERRKNRESRNRLGANLGACFQKGAGKAPSVVKSHGDIDKIVKTKKYEEKSIEMQRVREVRERKAEARTNMFADRNIPQRGKENR